MIAHHEFCFGCGQANLFGLQLELDARDDGSVAGRFFVKQDHQGPPGYAHGGVLATALDEAKKVSFNATVRIDTPNEWQYYRHGGILHYVLRQLLADAREEEEENDEG